ncbi:imidazolonepropionase [Ferrimicrobium sp.]|uniref:imidazolonepropionase n=1 Tax=Ferrimicrobium sp. TaxID=2926050 RepID=UPI0026254C73|nr:imidazolonepropionase [Ferrimicrobium sp.]
MEELLFGNCSLADVDVSGSLRFVQDGLIHIQNGRIAFAGPRGERGDLPRRLELLDLGSRLVTPGLVDCHTHLIYAGDRLGDFLAERDPVALDQHRFQSGGILATVAATNSAPRESLVTLARRRLDQMADHGVTSVEIKSGYGLSLEGERRLLAIARELSGYRDIEVVTSFLGAHTVPAAFADAPSDYIAFLVEEVMPILAGEGLIDMVDCFIDPEGFSPAVIVPYLMRAKELGLPLRAHVDQFGAVGGGELATRFGARSIDHLEHLSQAAIVAARSAGTVAVLLPFASLHKRFPTNPPVTELRAQGVVMAVATDLNPGTSPTSSLLLAAYLAVTLYGLRPVEAFAGVTRHGAQALGLSDRGSLEHGSRADLVAWEVAHPYELVTSVFDQRPQRLGSSRRGTH